MSKNRYKEQKESPQLSTLEEPNQTMDVENSAPKKLKRKEFENKLEELQADLVRLQSWVVHAGLKVVVVFEGRDAAGKGGVIKRITERVSPRVFHVVALSAPTEREKSQIYFQRYITNLPAAGEVMLFDRSWYNRAGVEYVMGFCTEEEHKDFLQLCPAVERTIINSGVILIKYWFDVSQEEQERRFEARINDPKKVWKLSPMDLESHRRWYDYSRAKDQMFEATDTPEAPWYVVPANNKRSARLNCISHLLNQIPHDEAPSKPITLPKRQSAKGYEEPARTYTIIPQIY